MSSLRIGIVGSRRRNTLSDMRIVYSIVSMMKDIDPSRKLIVVSGACRLGADNFAAQAARSFGVELIEFPVPKVTYISRFDFAKAAYARNLLIAENSDVGFALVHEDRTGGTENTVLHYNNLKKKVFLVDTKGKFFLHSFDSNNEISLDNFAGVA